MIAHGKVKIISALRALQALFFLHGSHSSKNQGAGNPA